MIEKLRYFLWAALVAIALVMPFALTGCGTDPGSGTVVSSAMTGETARRALYAASGTAVGLGNLAIAYGNLPNCPAAPPCKDPAIHARIYGAYRDVNTALDGAEKFLAANPQGDAKAALYAVDVAMGTLRQVLDANNIQYAVGAK